MPDVHIIFDILKQAQAAYPTSVFINSLMQQYQERGSLSKKQLEGLHSKASKIENIRPGKLATLQAIILKKHTNHRSIISTQVAPQPVDTGQKLIEAILQKFPQHKRVLFFKMKIDKAEALAINEKLELEKFYKLLV